MLTTSSKPVLHALTVVAVLTFAVPTVAELRFSGLDAAQEANARALSSLSTADCDSAHWRVERLFREADEDIRKALKALGYYEVTISKSLAWVDNCWDASFDVQPGEPVRLRAVEITIDWDSGNDPEFNILAKIGRPLPGEILHHGRYENYKKALLRTALDRGYFEAEFEHSEIRIERADKVADLSLQLKSGPRYRIGNINFTEGILRKNILEGYSDIQTGDLYSADAVNDLYDVLSGSGYFKSVSISTEPTDERTKSVPVSVSLTPGIRRTYSIGAGFATDTGPQARLGYMNRRKNDKGHQFESRLFWSSVSSELTGSYRWPGSDPRHEWISVVGGVQHENTDTSENDTFKIGVVRTRSVSASWLHRQYVDYAHENFKVGDQDTTSKLVIFGLNWESVIGREFSRVPNGHGWNFDLRGASDSLGSDTSFVQFQATTKWIHSLGKKTRILARARLGVTAKDDLSDLPASVRFFAGGDRSVRGYEFESLGPTDDTGQVIGGSNLLVGGLEIDYSLLTRWSIAAFIDSGNAFEGSELDFTTGVGIGIRWYSPIGPIRLDFAHPLDDPDENFRIHVGIGPDL